MLFGTAAPLFVQAQSDSPPVPTATSSVTTTAPTGDISPVTISDTATTPTSALMAAPVAASPASDGSLPTQPLASHFTDTGGILAGLDSLNSYIGLSGQDPRLILAHLIQIALGLLGIIFIVMILYSGFLWMISGGSEENVHKARSAFSQAIIGLIIILLANSVAHFVLSGLVSATTGTSGDTGNPVLVPTAPAVPRAEPEI